MTVVVWHLGAYPFVLTDGAPDFDRDGVGVGEWALSLRPSHPIAVDVEFEAREFNSDVPFVAIGIPPNMTRVPFSGSSYRAWAIIEPGPGLQNLYVNCNGYWRVRVFEPSQRWDGPNCAHGEGDAILNFQSLTTSSFTVEAEYEGKDRMSAYLLGEYDQVLDQLVNIDGPGSYRTLHFSGREASGLLVHARGPWALKVSGILRDPHA